jgi:hypothetical protein
MSEQTEEDTPNTTIKYFNMKTHDMFVHTWIPKGNMNTIRTIAVLDHAFNAPYLFTTKEAQV